MTTLNALLGKALNVVSRRSDQLRLSAADVARYHEQGFLGPYRAFTAEEIAVARACIYEQVLTAPNSLDLYRCQARHLDSVTVWRLCSAPTILQQLQTIAGPDLMLWYSNVFDKGPDQPMLDGEYPWHQDAWHGDLSVNTVGVWLALTETTPENGCVELIPATHRSDVTYERTLDSHYAAWFGGLGANPAELDESRKVVMALQPGEYFIFNERILHHSNRNLTPQRRTGLSFRVSPPRCVSDQIEPCVMLSGHDGYGVNSFAPAPAGEPAMIDLKDLPDTQTFRMDQPLYGAGWHLLERAGERPFRWTGPERLSWLDLRWSGHGDGLLRCQILQSAAPDFLQRLEIKVNEMPVDLTWRQSHGVVEVSGRIPAQVLERNGRRARIMLCLPETIRPSSHDPANQDARNLGLAICALAIEAAPAAGI